MEKVVNVKTPRVPDGKSAGKAVLKKVLKRFLKPILYFGILIILSILVYYLCGQTEETLSQYLFLNFGLLILGIVNLFLLKFLLFINENFYSLKLISFSILGAVIILGLFLYLNKSNYAFSIQAYSVYSLLAFLFPLVFIISWELFSSIPTRVFKPWFYPYGKEVPVIEVMDPQKINFYIPKIKGDNEYVEFSLNVPVGYLLGDFMHYFIHRYNYDKNPKAPIYISVDNANHNLYGWIFKTKGLLTKYRVLDPSKTFQEQNLGNETSIIVDRYSPGITSNEDEAESQELQITEN